MPSLLPHALRERSSLPIFSKFGSLVSPEELISTSQPVSNMVTSPPPPLPFKFMLRVYKTYHHFDIRYFLNYRTMSICHYYIWYQYGRHNHSREELHPLECYYS